MNDVYRSDNYHTLNGRGTGYHNEWQPNKIAVLGAGQIASSLLNRLTRDRTARELKFWNWQEREETGAFTASRLIIDQAALPYARTGNGYNPTSQFDFVNTDLGATIRGAEFIVLTSGEKRKPGMERIDLLAKNYPIVDQVAEAVIDAVNNGHSYPTLIVATNPVDAMNLRLVQKLKEKGFPSNRIIGLSGELDVTRMVQSICHNLDVGPEQIQDAYVVGAHSPNMVPVLSNTKIRKGDTWVSIEDYAKDYVRAHPERIKELTEEYVREYAKNNKEIIKAHGQNNLDRFSHLEGKERDLAISQNIFDEKNMSPTELILDKIREETKHGGTILTRHKGSSDGDAPAAAIDMMLKEFIKGHQGKETLPIYASVYSDTDRVSMGRRLKIKADGSFEIDAQQPVFNEIEQAGIRKSVAECKEMETEIRMREGLHMAIGH